MKKLILLVVAIAAIGVVQAQFEAKINPLGAIFGSPEISTEYVISDSFGAEVVLNFDFGQAYSGFIKIPGVNQSGFGVKAIGKYYFDSDDGGDGLYGGLYLRKSSEKYEDKSSTDAISFTGYDRSITSVGIEIGQKWVFGSGFLLESATGIGRLISEERTGFSNDFETGFADALGIDLDYYVKFAIGYRFN